MSSNQSTLGSHAQTSTTTNTTPDLSTAHLKNSYPKYSGQIQFTRVQESKPADTTTADDILPERILSNLDLELYTHQHDALAELEQGNDTCVATSTSSGKTLVYGLQIAKNHLESDKSATSLLLYPTKALSRDQEQALNDLYTDLGLDIDVQVYDGDTNDSRKKHIRDSADVVISNFSGINIYLHDHARWAEFYDSLSLIAIDELHAYTGVQGMHVAWIIRRLRRLLEFYDADPQFVLTSATIGNPAAHARNLTGRDVSVISNDGSPRGQREITFWQPPTNETEDGDEYGQRPADDEACDLLAHLATEDLQTLMFSKSRKQTEVNATKVQDAAERHPDSPNPAIDAYNAGRGKKTRRETEHRLKTGDLDGVISTSALELGIDIGSVDATILTGYPGTRQSFWQQIGRAGRNKADSLGIFIPSLDNIDQYIIDNPDHIFEQNVEKAVVDTSNNNIFADHILCAADELPLTTQDSKWFGESRLKQAISMWKKANKMVGTLETGARYDGIQRPQRDISVYGTDEVQFSVQCEGDDESIDIENINKERAYREFHPGAIHLHKGKQYEVTDLSERGRHPTITLERTDVDYYTQALNHTTIQNLETIESTTLDNGITLCYGKGDVNIEYYAYKSKQITTGKIVKEDQPLNLDPITLTTQLMWVEIPPHIKSDIKNKYSDDASPFIGGLHAIEHGIISMAPLELRISKDNLNGLSVLDHSETGTGTIFIYDGIKGGVGFSKAIFNNYQNIAAKTADRLKSCNCGQQEGCPACTMSHHCGQSNSPLHRPAANVIIDQFTDGQQRE
jgi:DEAD/DEAH box helicase domain-containing protein